MRALSWWMALAINVCPVASAVEVHRCGSGGAGRYQDVPCAAGERAVRWRAGAPGVIAPVPRSPRGAIPSAPQTVPRKGRRGARGHAALIPLERDPAACDRAQRARDTALQRMARRETYIEQRRWEDRLRDACR